MGKVRERLRPFSGPQFLILLVAIIMLVSAANPNYSLPVFASRQLKKGEGLTATAHSTTMPVIRPFGLRPPFANVLPHQANTSRLDIPGSPKSPAVDCDAVSCIALSFDDGPNSVMTPQALDALEQAQVTASFFVIGKNIPGNEALLQRMAKDDMEIGNHTWSHTDLTTLTPDQIRSELVSTQVAIAATGAPIPTLFRPPYGAVDDAVVGNAGLQTALWNEDPRDWQATDPAALSQAILASAKPGGIVDLHDTHPVTIAALGPTIQALKSQGYQFVTISQLLHSKARPGNAPFYGYEAGMFAVRK